LVWLIYFGLPQKVRWVFLLVASYVFYGWWKAEFAALMAFTSLIDWFCGMRIEKSNQKTTKQFWMWGSILSNVAMLFMFKYFHFALGNSQFAKQLYCSNLTAWIIELGKYTIPAGISFYTFQSISYIIDVYRGQEKAEHNLFRFMLYVSFFPQLVAGPIERFGRLHTQLYQKYAPAWEDIRNGFRIILYGLFLKVCVADNLASVVDTYYAAPASFSGYSAWIAMFFFAFQVYTDFFGYSLLAQGSALLFGIHLMDNFKKPYIAKSIPEFWHRWHISLSTWFRDYIFIPVGGNKHGSIILALAVMLVFFTSGLWHGASMTMIVFGLSQGILYLFDRFVFSRIKGDSIVFAQFKKFKTFLFFMLTLVWFRAQSIPQSAEVFQSAAFKNAGKSNLNIPIHIPLFLFIFWLLDNWIMKERADVWLNRFKLPVRWSFYAAVLLCIWLLGGSVNHPFVYFQF